MRETLEKIRKEALEALSAPSAELEELRIRYLGKKGELTAVLRGMGRLTAEERPVIGQLANDIREEIEKRIGELNEKDRMLIVLRDVRGMSYEEIASTLRLPLGTVKSRLKRAREQLVKILSADAELFGRENVSNTERRSKR